MPWEPFGRLVRARVAPERVEVVNAEMWDRETGAVLVVWPIPHPEIAGPRRWGPDIRWTEIAAGEWWELEGEAEPVP